ncbi:MAG: hypothetical protein VW082_04190 [Candidatus Nanopelagicales bacterium]
MDTLRMKKNHADVPMKASMGTRIFSRYRVIAVPPAFAAIVVIPASVRLSTLHPARQTTPHVDVPRSPVDTRVPLLLSSCRTPFIFCENFPTQRGRRH